MINTQGSIAVIRNPMLRGSLCFVFLSLLKIGCMRGRWLGDMRGVQ